MSEVTPTPTLFPPPGPVSDWEQVAVFRETFLSLLHPECAAAFRRVGETVYDWAIEDQFAFGRSAQSWINRDLRGAALDLRFSEAFLGGVGKAYKVSQLTEDEERLALVAARLGRRAGAMARKIEVSLRRVLELGPSPGGRS